MSSARKPTELELSARVALGRRQALLGVLAASSLACPAASPPPGGTRQGSTSAGAPTTGAPTTGSPTTGTNSITPATAKATEAPELEVIRLGPLKEEEKGGQLVVLLHGWGAEGDDLVPLGRALAQPRTRFLVPAAPLRRAGGGRAWWQLAGPNRPPHASKDELPPVRQAYPEVARASEAVRALVREARQRYEPDSVAVVGFSQGAMLALDVAVSAVPPVDRVAVLSGLMLVHSLTALHGAQGPRPRVLVAHGSRDAVVPFSGGESIKSILEPHGYPVTWVPFEGGHEISPRVITELKKFLS